MADVDPNDVCEVALIGDIDSTDEIVQAYQFTLTTGSTGMTGAMAFADWLEIFEALWTVIDALFTFRTAFRSIRAKNITKGTLLGEAGISPVLVGAAPGDQMPYQTTIPVSFSTIYPRVILKKMLGPLAATAIGTNGFVDAAAEAIAATYATMLISSFVSTNGDWKYGYQSPVALTFVRPVAGAVSKRPGGLNRRRAGRGS